MTPSSTEGDTSASDRSTQRRPRVLVVDDEESVRLKAGRTLLKESMDVREVSTVEAAIKTLDHWRPDVLIADLLFEHGSGLDVIRAFRSITTPDRAIVIVISVLDEFSFKLNAMRAGADAFFSKPIDWDVLARRLLVLMNRSDDEKARRVLLVEDEPLDSTRIRSMLGANGYQVLVCDDPMLFDDDLEGFQPDLILMDINLPGVSGYELARYARQHERYAATPIIFLTGDRSAASRVEAISSGGDDHITKPPSEVMLIRSIEARIHRAQTVKTLLERDGLTGLLTHSVVMSRMAEIVLEKQRRPEREFTLVLLDIDHFKDVNDRYGHVVGDKVLTSLSAFLRAQLRATDIIGRYGGEEFVVVLPDTSPETAFQLISRLLENFASLTHVGENGEGFQSTFSAGIAGLEAGWSLEEWKVLTDKALYDAKEAGRNRVVIAGAVTMRVEHTTGVLDPVIVASLRELGRRSNTDLLSEVAEMFLRVSPERMESLRTAERNGDARSLEMTAHAFRSAAANLGASTLADHCEKVEALARAKNLAMITSMIVEIERELERVTSTLTGLKGQAPNPT